MEPAKKENAEPARVKYIVLEKVNDLLAGLASTIWNDFTPLELFVIWEKGLAINLHIRFGWYCFFICV